MTIRQEAAKYYQLGANVLAIAGDEPAACKRPAHPWKDFIGRRQTVDEAGALPWEKGHISGVGIVLGPGGWRDIEFDDCEGFTPVERLLDALGLPHSYKWLYKSSRGYHIVIGSEGALPGGFLSAKSKREAGVRVGIPKNGLAFDHLEVRWEGCQSVVPPSMHSTGITYEWVNGRPDKPPITVPVEKFVRAVESICKPAPAERNARTTTKARTADFSEGIERELLRRAVQMAEEACANGAAKDLKGNDYKGRNDAGLWLACQLRDALLPIDAAAAVMYEYVEAVAELRPEPYTTDEAEMTLEGAYRDEPREPWSTSAKSDDRLCLEDFYSLATENKCIFAPACDLWPNTSVNQRLKPVLVGTDEEGKEQYEKAAVWLAQHRSVEQLSWIPGEPQVVEDVIISAAGRVQKSGCRTFNLYRPPVVELGDPGKAGPYLEHLQRIYPSEHEHIRAYLSFKVQQPGTKINHALVLGGAQGIGKDTLLAPVRKAVGEHNFADISPVQFTGRFNSWVKSVFLRVSEARDLGDVDRYSFYEHAKTFTAVPPEMLRCDEKNVREYYVPNVTGVILTTNHKTNGIYLPEDDRRHFVAWSEAQKEDFPEDYWRELWGWYDGGGYQHVAAYFHEYDLSDFDPKAPPPKTNAFWEIVDANRAPEDAELADALDAIAADSGRDQWPAAVTISMIANVATSEFAEWLSDRRNRRQIPFRFEAAGYVPVRNEAVKDGYWVIGGKRQSVYARKSDSQRDRIAAANKLCGSTMNVPF